MDQKYTDSEIKQGLKAEDQQVFTYLFNEFYTALRRFAGSLIKNPEEAQDIVVETFTKFWKIKNNFDSFVNVRAFLYITVRNNCFDYLKMQQRKAMAQKEILSLSVAETGEEFELAQIKEEVIRKVYREIESLPPRCREVFKLTYLKGLKANEIADIMQISVSSVTSHRARAIELLRMTLSVQEFALLYLLISSVMNEPHISA